MSEWWLASMLCTMLGVLAGLFWQQLVIAAPIVAALIATILIMIWQGTGLLAMAGWLGGGAGIWLTVLLEERRQRARQSRRQP